jgi:glycosyltransferase involved in cell wall biosynthesis
MGISLQRSIFVLIFNLYAVFRLAYYIYKNKIDVIYSNTSVTCLGIITAIFFNKKHIWHFHESTCSEIFKDRKLAHIYKYLFHYKNNITVFISNRQKREWEFFTKYSIENYKIIYNPNKEINVLYRNQSYGLNENIVYGFLGSFCQGKNILLLIKVFSDLRKTVGNVRLVLGGDGIERKSIENSIKKYSLGSSVELLGPVYDVSFFFSQIDIFILPSLYESWGLSAIEAMLAQKAVVLTTNTALHELFEDKKDCIFFDPWNELELYNSMKLLLDKDIRSSLGINGYNKVFHHDFNKKFQESIKLLLK